MSVSSGRPRPFLEGVFRTACNSCVSSKRGCSGGEPCEQCEKRGKACVYAQRRKSGPRGRPASGRTGKGRSRAKARQWSRAAATAAVAAGSPAPGSGFVERGDASRTLNEVGEEPGLGDRVVDVDVGFLGAGSGSVSIQRPVNADENSWEWEQRMSGNHHTQQHNTDSAGPKVLFRPAAEKRRPPSVTIPQPFQSQVSGPIMIPRLAASSPESTGTLEIPLPPRPTIVRSPKKSVAAGCAEGSPGFFGRGDGSSSSSVRVNDGDNTGISNKRARFVLTAPLPSPVAPPGSSPAPLPRSRSPVFPLFTSRSKSEEGPVDPAGRRRHSEGSLPLSTSAPLSPPASSSGFGPFSRVRSLPLSASSTEGVRGGDWVQIPVMAAPPRFHGDSQGSFSPINVSSVDRSTSGSTVSKATSGSSAGQSWSATEVIVPALYSPPRFGGGDTGAAGEDLFVTEEKKSRQRQQMREGQETQRRMERLWLHQQQQQQREELHGEQLRQRHLLSRQLSLQSLLMAEDDEPGESSKHIRNGNGTAVASTINPSQGFSGSAISMSTGLLQNRESRTNSNINTAQLSPRTWPLVSLVSGMAKQTEPLPYGTSSIGNYVSSKSTPTSVSSSAGYVGNGVGAGGGMPLLAKDGGQTSSLPLPFPLHRRISDISAVMSSPLMTATEEFSGLVQGSRTFIPRAVSLDSNKSVDNARFGGYSAAQLDCAAMANMRTPLTGEASLVRAVDTYTSSLAVGKQDTILHFSSMGDFRAPLLREASLLRAMEAVSSGTEEYTDGGVDYGEAEGELPASAGLGELGGEHVFCDTSSSELAAMW